MVHHRKRASTRIRSFKKKKHFYQKPVFWILSGMLVLATAGIYSMFFWPFIQVDSIEISGTQNTSTQDIQAIVTKQTDKTWMGAKTGNIFLIDTRAISKEILATFPAIESATVQKKYPSKITVAVQERQPFSVFCQNSDHCFSIDKNGVIFQAANAADADGMIIDSQDTKQLLVGEEVVNKNTMDAIAKIQTNLKNNFNIDIRRALVSNPLIFTTSEHWRIYFDPNADIDLQVNKMNLLLKNQIPEAARQQLQYIYLQYKDRAYYQ